MNSKLEFLEGRRLGAVVKLIRIISMSLIEKVLRVQRFYGAMNNEFL